MRKIWPSIRQHIYIFLCVFTICIGLLYAACIALISVLPHYQSQITREFSLLINEPVNFSQIKFSWRGFKICTKVYDVDIGHPNAKFSVNKIKKIELLLHPVKSLLNLKPVIDSVMINGGNIKLDLTNTNYKNTSDRQVQDISSYFNKILNTSSLDGVAINTVNLKNTHILVNYAKEKEALVQLEYAVPFFNVISGYRYNYIHGKIYKINKQVSVSNERELLELAIKISKIKKDNSDKFYIATNSSVLEHIFNNYLISRQSQVSKVVLAPNSELKIWGGLERDEQDNFTFPKTLALAVKSPSIVFSVKNYEDIYIKNINGKFTLNITNLNEYNTGNLIFHAVDLNFAGSRVRLSGDINKYDENKPSVINAKILFGNTPIKDFFEKLPASLIGKNTADWLNSHVRSGYLGKSQIIWHGDLDSSFPYDSDVAQANGVFNLNASIVNATLDYSPGTWPAIENLNGNLVLRGQTLELESNNATINGSIISSLNATIKNISKVDNNNILITSKIKTSGLELHKVITTTPLKQNLEGVNNYTQFNGPINLDLDLNVPLADATHTEVSGKLHFVNNSLAVYNTPFNFESLNGKISFTNNTVNGENLAAKFHDQQAFISINNDNDGTGTRVELDSVLDFKNLFNYYKMPLEAAIDGSSVFNLVLKLYNNSIENKTELHLVAESDLVGVKADIPGIFSKQEIDVSKLKFDMEYDLHDYFKYTLSIPNQGYVTNLEWNQYQKNNQVTVDAQALKGQFLFSEKKDNIETKFSYLNLDQLLSGNSSSNFEIDYFSFPSIKATISNLIYNNTDIENISLNLGSDNKNKIFYVRDFSINNALFKLKMSAEHVATKNDTKQGVFEKITHLKHSAHRSTNLRGKYRIKDAQKTIKLFTNNDFHNQMNINGNFDLKWNGELLFPSLNDLTGEISITSGKGIISDIEPGIGRVFSLFNLEILSKRLFLDFSDVFERGYIFDSVRGKFKLEKGVLSTNRAIVQAGSADIDLYGDIDIKNKNYNLKADVMPHITTSLPIAAAFIATPVAGAAVFIIDKLLDSPMEQLTESAYSIQGSWVEPKVKKLKSKRGPLIEVSWLNPVVDDKKAVKR